MLDLFSIADKNADNIYKAFNNTITDLPDNEAKQAKEFAEWVEAEALISINLRLFVIAELLGGMPYRNIHEWAQEQATLSGRTKDEILRERLKGFYEKRMTFDQAFEKGEYFRYGALNAGCLGLFAYGAYCAVLTCNFQQSLNQSAYLPDDSLENCFSNADKFDHNILEQSAAPYSHRHWLATNKRIAEVGQTPKKDWGQLLISPASKQYVEIIFIGEITMNSLQCIRISNEEYMQMWELAFGNFSRSQSDAERAWVQDFNQLLHANKDGKIQLKVIS